MNVAAATAQCPVFQLQIYGIEVSDRPADILNVSVAEFSDPAWELRSRYWSKSNTVTSKISPSCFVKLRV
jgi:hypothetical protein